MEREFEEFNNKMRNKKLKIVHPHKKRIIDCVLTRKGKGACLIEYKPNRYVIKRWVCNEYLTV